MAECPTEQWVIRSDNQVSTFSHLRQQAVCHSSCRLNGPLHQTMALMIVDWLGSHSSVQALFCSGVPHQTSKSNHCRFIVNPHLNGTISQVSKKPDNFQAQMLQARSSFLWSRHCIGRSSHFVSGMETAKLLSICFLSDSLQFTILICTRKRKI